MTDLLVLGAGAAGMFAALRTAALGREVVLADPHWSTPNTLAVSGGLVPAAGSRRQRAAGVLDTPQHWLDDLRAFAGDSVNERIAMPVAHALPDALDFLETGCGVAVRFLPDVPAPGHGVARFHAATPASGRALHDALRAAVLAEPRIRVVRDRPAAGVARDADGTVTVDWAAGPDGTPLHIRAARTLVAGGGFGANPAMLAEFLPAMAGAVHGGPPTNDGSTIALGRAWGGALGGMDGYQGQGHSNPDGRTRLGMSLPSLGAILVDRTGRRFVREDVGPSELAAHVLACPGGVALEVFDARLEAALGEHSAYAEARAAGRVLAADDVATLASFAGVPAAALREALDDAAAVAHGVRADPLGRARVARPLEPPYRASWVTGALAHTQGGLVTDGEGRVLDAAERPLPGLYAAGGAAAGLAGRGGAGYLPGNGLAQAFGLAWRAAAAIAAGD
ncbi:MAG: FAD-binding protein [Burkholderiales bacterium]|nr:FAD-binding protein [Burkholderiales bacterium]